MNGGRDDALSRPDPSAYGLTAQAVARCQAQKARLDSFVPKGAVAGAVVVGLAFLFGDPTTAAGDWIGRGIGALFLSYVSMFGIGLALGILVGVFTWAAERWWPTWRRKKRFDAAVARHNAALREREAAALRAREDFWRQLDGHRFEQELGAVYRKLGYAVTVTRGSGDEGIDLILVRTGTTTVVQCKAHAKPVGPAVMRELWGAMHAHGAGRCILASIGGFTRGAVTFARGKAVQLLDLEGILALQQASQGHEPGERGGRGPIPGA
jgi:hypothetical protein